MMRRKWFLIVSAAAVLLAGCVERRLTIVTEPSEAVVWLNDEEIGATPVTVNFNWYGDYNVRIEKAGYQILNTHRPLERPLHDRFPFDFFAEVLWPGRIVGSYEWQFQLQPFQPASADQLVQAAEQMRQRTAEDVGKTAVEILTETAK